MKNSTGKPWLDRLIRTVLQFVVSGSALEGVTVIAGGLSAAVAAIVLMVVHLVITAAQNALEDAGTIKPLLKGSSEAEYAQQLGVPPA